MKPQEVGNFVKLGMTMIPAVNIQVEGVPGMIKVLDDEEAWYGVYFEILFETGALWIVQQGGESEEAWKSDQSISVAEYPQWGLGDGYKQLGVTVGVRDWAEFLSLYHEKRTTRGQAC